MLELRTPVQGRGQLEIEAGDETIVLRSGRGTELAPAFGADQ